MIVMLPIVATGNAGENEKKNRTSETQSHLQVHENGRVGGEIGRVASTSWGPILHQVPPYTIRSAIFFKFRFFGLSNDPNEISNVKKKSLKKIKYWKRNGGLKFWPEVKNYPSDWHIQRCFLESIFFTWGGHCKELKLIGNLSDCPKFWQWVD